MIGKKDIYKTTFEDSLTFSQILNKELNFFEKKFDAKEKEGFYSELSLLLATGVNIKTAFDIIIEDLKVIKHRALLENIQSQIINGTNINKSFATHSGIFTKYEIQSIKIGEETGKLPEVLKELGLFYAASVKLKRQITGVLTYPLVVVSMSVLIVYFMLVVVVPVFSDIFLQTGHKLPALTLFLIDISNNSSLIFYILFLFICALFLVHKTQKKKNWYRKTTSSFFLKIPIINTLIKKVFLARFCQSMKLLTGAKVVVNESLELVKNMIEFYPIEQALTIVIKEVVNEGKLLNESLAAHSIFPKKLVSLIKLSEEVNAPELIYDKLHSQYVAEIEHQQVLVGKLIEPIFIIVLGFFVGFILVAMYLPMFEMSTNTF